MAKPTFRNLNFLTQTWTIQTDPSNQRLQFRNLKSKIKCLQYSAHSYASKNPGCYPVCGIHRWNEWKSDVKSWMKPDRLPRYYSLLRSGESHARQAAHQIIESGHCTYCFYLAGSKYLLQMLLQLPILAQCMRHEPDHVEVPALGRWIADLQNHQESDEYIHEVQKSQKRSDEHRRLNQQIWNLSRELTIAKTLAIKRNTGEWENLTQDKQCLVEAYDAGKLHRRLQNLVEEKTPVYRGSGTFMVDTNGLRLQRFRYLPEVSSTEVSDMHWRHRRC